MVWRTIEEVNLARLQIIKGSKCKLRGPNNECLWHDDQLQDRKRYYSPGCRYSEPNRPDYYDDVDYDAHNFGEDLYGHGAGGF